MTTQVATMASVTTRLKKPQIQCEHLFRCNGTADFRAKVPDFDFFYELAFERRKKRTEIAHVCPPLRFARLETGRASSGFSDA
jgi:hypothetical protein